MYWILTEFWPNSDVKSSNGSIPRRSNLSTQVQIVRGPEVRPAQDGRPDEHVEVEEREAEEV